MLSFTDTLLIGLPGPLNDEQRFPAAQRAIRALLLQMTIDSLYGSGADRDRHDAGPVGVDVEAGYHPHGPAHAGDERLRALAAIRGSDESRTCPILALTAFDEVGEREKALAAGFDGFFSKPITPETFMDQLEAFLDGGDRRGAAGGS